MRRAAGRKRRNRAIWAAATSEPMEARWLLSFTPYVSGGWTATPSYAYLDAATGQTETATPLGSTSPAGAPLTPATMRSAYGLGTVGSSNVTFDGVQGDGTGQTIAIVDVGSDPTIASDLSAFDGYYGLPNPPSFQQLSQTGSSTSLPAPVSGWIGEISLDVEWSHVMAPDASIVLIAASDLYAGVEYAATIPGVSVVSMSFTISGNAPDADFVTPSGHGGVTFLAGAGDTGSEVPSPAQSDNVVAVGGTNLQLNGTAYGSESAWSATGGGVSSSEPQPTYQNGIVSAFSTTQRTTPDVSIDGDPGSGVAIYSATDGGASTPWELIIGGTSLSTPLFAGIVAVADQGRVAAGLTTLDGGSQTLPRLYELYEAASGNYHDITTGNNGHAAEVGYDLASGVGSPVANKLIPDLAGDDTVSGRAFTDANGNGTYDAGIDTPLAGQRVYLDLNNSGAQEPIDPVTTTDANGLYSFTDVIGSVTGTVRLVGTTGTLPEAAGTFTTSYQGAQTYNLAFSSTTVFTATANPTSTTKSTTLGVTITGTVPAGLTYTWAATTVPAAGAAATFSANGTAAARNATATFNAAGTYVLTVKATNAAGQFATSSVTVTVTQVLTSIGVSPPTGLTAGQSEQLVALGYDQFGNLIGTQAGVTWSVASGGGTVSPGGVYTPPTGTLATVRATYGTLTATGTVPVVNSPWTSVDVGTVTATGIAYDLNGDTTLTDTSDDIWNASDDFHFDYLEVSGDVTVTAELLSQTSASPYIKAGVMVRNTLDPDSAMAMEADPSPGPLFEWRTAAAATAAQDATSGATAPQWLRIVRSGSTLTGYSSPNDVTWTETGTETITMNTTVYVGLALTSHDASHIATAVFSNVSVVANQTLTTIAVSPNPDNLTAGQPQQLFAVAYDQNGLPMATQPAFTWALTSGGGTLTAAGVYTPPSTGTLATVTATSGSVSATGTVAVVQSPWTSVDVGTVSAPGTAYDSATTTTLTDTSDDIWNQSDDFHFDYQQMTGNGTITAKLVSQTSASAYIKAGLMIRSSLDPAAPMVMVADPSPGPLFEWRTTEAGTAAQDATSVSGAAPAEWLRLVRAGNLFSAYYSKNGTSWTLIGTQTVAMGATAYVGLALTSHDTSNIATAVFSNVTLANPSIATAASATPNPVTATTTNLSVLGATPAGESTLTYTWAVTTIPTGAAAPTFSVNGTNAAKATTATFSSAGAYGFTVTVTDALGQSVTSAVTVTVNPTLTSITLAPTTAGLSDAQTAQFTPTAKDQFGAALATQPTFTWTVDAGGVGTVSATGLYAAPATGSGSATVRATSGTVSGTAAVTVTGTVVSVINGTSGNDVIRLVRSGANLLVYVDNATTPAYTLAYASLTTLTVNTGAGTDTVDVDYSGGATPVPAGGLTVQGGGGNDALVLTGTTGSDRATVSTTTITLNGSATGYAGFSSVTFDGDGGSDGLTQAAQPGNGATLTFNATTAGGTSAADTLTVNGGTYAFPAPTAGTGITSLPLAALSVGAGGTVSVGSAAAAADRWVVTTGSLSITTGGRVDLGSNDMVVTAGAATAISGYAATGYAAGAWTGLGLASSAAAADPSHLTALGVAQNVNTDGTTPLYTTFDGVAVTASAVLVKFTDYGDANLDGNVDEGDYTRVDAGFIAGGKLAGWSNGDFNYDGSIDGSDYTLMDNAFNQQGVAIAAVSVAPATVTVAPKVVAAVATTAAPARQAVAKRLDMTARRAAPLPPDESAWSAPTSTADDRRKTKPLTAEIDSLE